MDMETGNVSSGSELDGATIASAARISLLMRYSDGSTPPTRSPGRLGDQVSPGRRMGLDESSRSPATSASWWSIPGLSFNDHLVSEPSAILMRAAPVDSVQSYPGDPDASPNSTADDLISFMDASFGASLGEATTTCCDTAAEEMPVGTRGFTACCDGKPVVCVIETNLDRPPMSNILDPNIEAGEPPPPSVKSKLEECARAHEQAHIDSGDVGDCTGKHSVPTGFDPAMSAEDRALAEFSHNVDQAECIMGLDCGEDPACLSWRNGLAMDKHMVAADYYDDYMDALIDES